VSEREIVKQWRSDEPQDEPQITLPCLCSSGLEGTAVTLYSLLFVIWDRYKESGIQSLAKAKTKQNKNSTHLGYVLFTFLSV